MCIAGPVLNLTQQRSQMVSYLLSQTWVGVETRLSFSERGDPRATRRVRYQAGFLPSAWGFHMQVLTLGLKTEPQQNSMQLLSYYQKIVLVTVHN